MLAAAYRNASRGWRLLALSGVPLALTGVNFVFRFWHPSPGPFVANEVYPFGSHLDAWAVSFGFAWIAFGLLFGAVALLGSAEPGWRRTIWNLLLLCWILCWTPHGIIGAGFAYNGANQASVETYRQWASRPAGLMLLLFNAACLGGHFVASLLGFLLARRSLAVKT